jgi:2,3-bisphosphoglycerate-dependent phosphoglycerate mutase
MQLYLIRHAESENNALWARTQSENGRSPDPLLTETGHQQAAILAHFLAQTKEIIPDDTPDVYNHNGFPFTHLYCSLMERAVQTGMYIAEAKQMPLIAWEMIHEWGGIFENDRENDMRRGLPGANRAFFEQHYPLLVLPEELGETGWWNRPFEPREASYGRARQFLQLLDERHGATNDQVAIVTHGGFFFSFMSVLMNGAGTHEHLRADKPVYFAINNASITRVDFMDDRIRLVYLNRIDHLPPELIT